MSRWTTTSIAPRFLLALLDQAGVHADDLLGQAGIDRQSLATPDFACPLPIFHELWARAAALQPDIGLSLVERFPPGQMHVLAHLVLRSATLGTAISDLGRYCSVTSAADRLWLEREGDLARLVYACRAPGPANPWMAEHYFSMATVFMAQACGRPLPLQGVEFAAPMQAGPADYLHRFGLMPRFAAPRNALAFDALALDWPLATHDPYLHDILERVAMARRNAAPDAALDELRREIANALLLGRTPSLDATALACGLGPRALRTRLAEAETSFRKLLDEARCELAREHLARGLSATEAAYLLGFSEPAAFQHACRRWFGMSAGEFRRLLAACA